MTPTALLLAVLVILVAVVLSPLGLLWIGERPGYDWPLLGNVGQAYGAASAILAGLALTGVVASLIIQAREAKAAREQALRALHTDLLKMAIDDPGLLECWGPIEQSTDREWFRKHVYTNLIVSHWQLMWEVDLLSEPHLEVLADQFFKGAAGRRFWAEARAPRMKAETSRRARRFTAVVDDRYHAAIATGLPVDSREPIQVAADPARSAPSDRPEDERDTTDRLAYLAVGMAVAAGAVAVGQCLFRRRWQSGR
ncbi:hypothetical protein C1I95_21190 [Micromonospora craterilacus]|uniref:Uncharacterized protein n=2 Tax=Micromonospora craterilacus TaxID=1655439 RepID=A0A2W2EQQ1_9ACTN|nr:hypothetical protein C1I95_21190 [Micromonospora craterilacus]